MGKEKLVTVVVPIYKVEDYLEECIDSILNQTYKNFEVILVDDGSPDRCGMICDKYAEYDSRVTVIHKENGGLSDARNAGIEIAQGDYITFIDSDDYVTSDYLEILIFTAEIYNADIVQCQDTSQKNKLGTYKYKKKRIYTDNNEILKKYLLFDNILVCAQEKIYKTSLFKKIRFPFGRINEDTCTTYKLLFESSKYVCIGNILYFFRIRETSITHSDFSSKRLEILNVPYEMRCYLGNEESKYKEELIYYEFRLKIYLYNLLVRGKKDGVYENNVAALRQDIINTGKNKYINIKYLFVKKLLKYNESMYKYVIQNIWKK